MSKLRELRVGVVVLSGGIDSTVTAWLAKEEMDKLYIISFDYGQRHAKELMFAEQQSQLMGISDNHIIVDLTSLKHLLSKSALVNEDLGIPEGHYADKIMASTVVPNRNSIMINWAAALAIRKNAEYLYVGVHAVDHAIYPDGRPEFIGAIENCLKIANEGFIHPEFRIKTPFLYSSKAKIIKTGESLKVDWKQTWSCYKGDAFQCGRCVMCVERKVAFLIADVIDPTEYGYGYDDLEFLASAIPDLSHGVLNNSTSKHYKIRQSIIKGE